MSFQPADFPGFGGLNLAADAQDSPGAVDLSNVTLSQPGPSRLLPRPGYTRAGTTDLSGVTGIAYVDGYSVTGGATNLYVLDASLRASKTDFTTGDPWTVVSFGGAQSELPAPTISNASFATNTTGWGASGSTITRDTGTFDTTPASLRWDNTGASDALGSGDTLSTTSGSPAGTFYQGVRYQISVRMKGSATGTVVGNFGILSGSTDIATRTFSLTTSWTTYTIEWIPTQTYVSGSGTGAALGFGLTSPTAIYMYLDTVAFDVTGAAYAVNGAAFGKILTDNTISAPTVSTQAASETEFTAGRAAPTPYTVAVQPKDNRLVCWGFDALTAGPNGQVSSGSHAYFSKADQPEKYDETDYVILAPGDGETGRAACAYNDYLFLFKQSKFFVFYGNSVDSTGGTVFNYRTVGNAFGGSSSAIYQGQVCSAPSGVYVITDTGVWKTTGGAPQLVSGALSPLFNQNVSTLAYQGTGYTRLAPRSATGSGGAFWHQGKVYFSVTITRSTATTSSGWLVLDEQSGQWVVWELADTPRVGYSSPIDGAVFASGVSTTNRKCLLLMDGTATTDNGTAIASYYTSPYLTYGEPKAEKHVRASELHGTGTVTLAWGKDLQTHGTAESVAMSSGIGHARTGARGRSLSFKIAASAAGWTVNRVVPLLQTVRTGR